jgi:hypothetical protein
VESGQEHGYDLPEEIFSDGPVVTEDLRQTLSGQEVEDGPKVVLGFVPVLEGKDVGVAEILGDANLV